MFFRVIFLYYKRLNLSIFRPLQLNNNVLKSCEKRSNIGSKSFCRTIDKDEEFIDVFFVS